MRLLISTKFNGLLFGGTLISAVAVAGTVYTLSTSFVSQAMEDKLAAVENEFRSELAASQQSATMLAVLVAEQQVSKDAMASGNRDILEKEFSGAFKALKEAYDVRQFQFHTPPAISFFRVHDPETFGDDLASFRKTVVQVNTSVQKLGGLEGGKAGIGVRGLAPIVKDGSHLGSVEFGLSLHKGFVEKFTRRTGHPAAIFAGSGTELQAIGTTFQADLDPAKVLDLQDLAGQRTVFETMPETSGAFASLVFPVEDFSGDTIGLAVVAVDRTNYNAIAATGQWAAAAVFLLMLAIAAVIAFISRPLVYRPLARMTDYMALLSRGDLQREVPYLGRTDEVGSMAQAVEVFRTSALRNIELEQQAEETRESSEQERARTDAEKAEQARHLQAAVDALGKALKHLADGDLSVRISQDMPGSLAILRDDFNTSVESLASALSSIAGSSQTIAQGTAELRHSTEDLSKRTEQQAAALEETAAALDQITATVRAGYERAEDISRMVGEASTVAEQSGQILDEAARAMGEIETSSNQVTQIISVIDEIAFQTNLLALNAGVEAARAGEAGKGFAVVAQEVRELAQRSASAATEIKSLLDRSGGHVRSGVTLVSRTGEALQKIGQHVMKINDNIKAMVSSLQEQSVGLQQINSAVNQMDQVTQQNAAMVEEASAAVRTVFSETDALNAAVGHFQLEPTTPASSARRKAA